MDDVGWSLVLMCGCIAVSLFFSLHRQTLISFSRLKLQDAFRKAGCEDKVEEFLRQAEPLSLMCGFFRVAADTAIILLLAQWLADRHYLLTFAAALVILEIFNLVIPHAWAKHAGEYILPRTWGLLKGLMWMMRPLLYVFALHDRFVRRLAGVPVADPEQEQEERQERFLILSSSSLKGSSMKRLEMIENVLELTRRRVRISANRLVAVSVDADLPTVLEVIRREGHSRLPVYEGTIDNIVGLIYVKDLLEEVGKDRTDFNIRKRMRPVYFVPESKPLRDLLHEFQKQKLHFAVVLDEYGGTAGIVTIEDILEELVGDIADEYEKPVSESFRKIDETTYEVDARMYIDDINHKMDIELPDEEDYDTVGGFVFSHLGYIPKAGESFVYKDLRFTVTGASPRSIKRLRIQKLTPQKSID